MTAKKKKFLIATIFSSVIFLGLVILAVVKNSEKKISKPKDSNSIQIAEPGEVELMEEEAEVVATIEILSDAGLVSALAPDSKNWIEVYNGQKIPAGTKIMTDNIARAQLVFPNGTITRLDKNTEVELTSLQQAPSKIKVSLNLGRIWSRVTKILGKEELYQTETDTVVATVRGTSYGHELRGKKSIIMVAESNVDASCQKIKQAIRVKEGYKVDLTCNLDIEPKIVKINELDKKTEWYIFNQEQDGGDGDEDVLGTEDDLEDEEAQITCTGPDGKRF